MVDVLIRYYYGLVHFEVVGCMRVVFGRLHLKMQGSMVGFPSIDTLSLGKVSLLTSSRIHHEQFSSFRPLLTSKQFSD